MNAGDESFRCLAHRNTTPWLQIIRLLRHHYMIIPLILLYLQCVLIRRAVLQRSRQSPNLHTGVLLPGHTFVYTQGRADLTPGVDDSFTFIAVKGSKAQILVTSKRILSVWQTLGRGRAYKAYNRCHIFIDIPSAHDTKPEPKISWLCRQCFELGVPWACSRMSKCIFTVL